VSVFHTCKNIDLIRGEGWKNYRDSEKMAMDCWQTHTFHQRWKNYYFATSDIFNFLFSFDDFK
jgi:hypothetical protein